LELQIRSVGKRSGNGSLTGTQILYITCDNATNNTVMVGDLAITLPEYGGEAGHAQCFLHTTNLVAKSCSMCSKRRRGVREVVLKMQKS
jgi:uncharacterized Zn-finger protein